MSGITPYMAAVIITTVMSMRYGLLSEHTWARQAIIALAIIYLFTELIDELKQYLNKKNKINA